MRAPHTCAAGHRITNASRDTDPRAGAKRHALSGPKYPAAHSVADADTDTGAGRALGAERAAANRRRPHQQSNGSRG